MRANWRQVLVLERHHADTNHAHLRGSGSHFVGLLVAALERADMEEVGRSVHPSSAIIEPRVPCLGGHRVHLPTLAPRERYAAGQ